MTRLPQPVADAVITLTQQRGIKHASALRYYRRHGSMPLSLSAPAPVQFPPTPGPLFKGRRVQDTIMDNLRQSLNPTPTAKTDQSDMIFVFGSNTAGVHGAGAAKFALTFRDAVYGQGLGRQGNSYAIATRTTRSGSRWIVDIDDFNEIVGYVNDFLDYARQNPDLEFQVTQIGCGHAKYTADQMAPLFVNAPSNCLFDTAWESYLPSGTRFWGTF